MTDRRTKQLGREAGVTLVELMISVLLFAILAAGALAVLSAQQSTSASQQRTDSSLDAARTTLSAIERQVQTLKGAAPGGLVIANDSSTVPTGTTLCPASGGRQVAVIQVSSDSDGRDVLRLLYPDGSAWGNVAVQLDPGMDTLTMRTADDSTPAFAVGNWALLTNFDASDAAVVFKVDTGGVSPGCGTSSTDFCVKKLVAGGGDWASAGGPANFDTDSFVISMDWVEYRVDTSQFGADLPTLVVQSFGDALTEPAAVGIEDLQVALWIDADNDGQVGETGSAANDDELVFNVAGESLTGMSASLGTIPTSDCDLSRLRGLRLTIVARATTRDEGAKLKRPDVEDNIVSATPDGFYRVVLSSMITLRNTQ